MESEKNEIAEDFLLRQLFGKAWWLLLGWAVHILWVQSILGVISCKSQVFIGLEIQMMYEFKLIKFLTLDLGALIIICLLLFLFCL